MQRCVWSAPSEWDFISKFHQCPWKSQTWCVYVLYSRCESTTVLQSSLTLITSWRFSPSESVFQPLKPAAAWQWEGIGTNICLEHGINGTLLALAFLKQSEALCGCTDWCRKQHSSGSEWMLWQHRLSSPFCSQLAGIFELLESKLTLDAVYWALQLSVTSSKLAISLAFHSGIQPLGRQLCLKAHLSGVLCNGG